MSSDPDLQIRPERPDQPEVVGLLAELDRYLASLYPPEANHILSVQDLLSPDIDFLVARVGGRVVGTGACRRMPGEPATDGLAYGEIKRMMVAPDQRGHGVARRLLAQLESRLMAHGTRLALLETGVDQHAAIRLYRAAGYRDHRAFGGYPDNGLSLFLGKAL